MTMSTSMSTSISGGNECKGELLGQSRRGALTDAGRLALDAHLAACASCRLARDVLADFDHADVVDIRDGARVRAMVDLARATRTGARGHARVQRRLRAAAAAAALLVCGGSASAAVWWFRQPAREAPPADPPPIVAAHQDAHRTPLRHAAPAPAVSAPDEDAARAAAPAARPRALARHAAANDGARPTAAALLAEAGRARGVGELDRAVAIYRRLQREYPGTQEALVSAVPLGRLLLDGGSAQAALAAFDGYLRDVPRGALVAEALYGKGRALEVLGDAALERKLWERLVADHAGSAYAPHAQRRLAALR
jgi:hypothetical protein